MRRLTYTGAIADVRDGDAGPDGQLLANLTAMGGFTSSVSYSITSAERCGGDVHAESMHRDLGAGDHHGREHAVRAFRCPSRP
jgi:hypothetical protein